VTKTNLSGLSREELVTFCTSLEESNYRAGQIFSWIHAKLVSSFAEMTDLSISCRARLEEVAVLESLTLISIQDSTQTSARKFLFELFDGARIESVYLPDSGRHTVCLSSQVGCPLDCSFCATGKMGFIRNLTAAEIMAQLICIQKEVDERISNVVFMGMGEPLLNYDAVVKAASLINDKNGFAIGARKIIISTAGIVSNIVRFADEGHRFGLAFSLNATGEASRSAVMPITKKYTLADCLDALSYYSKKLRRQVTLEYILMNGVNDSDEDARRLSSFTRRLKCKLNIIPYNPIPGDAAKRPTKEELNTFVKKLLPSKSIVTVRWSQGSDISAACGQLYSQIKRGTARKQMEETSAAS